jgi:hypothetical protein
MRACEFDFEISTKDEGKSCGGWFGAWAAASVGLEGSLAGYEGGLGEV